MGDIIRLYPIPASRGSAREVMLGNEVGVAKNRFFAKLPSYPAPADCSRKGEFFCLPVAMDRSMNHRSDFLIAFGRESNIGCQVVCSIENRATEVAMN